MDFNLHTVTHFNVRVEIEVLRISSEIFPYYVVTRKRRTVRILKGKVRYLHHFLRNVRPARGKQENQIFSHLSSYIINNIPGAQV